MKPLLIVAVTLMLFGCAVNPPVTEHRWVDSIHWAYPDIAEESHTMSVGRLARTWLLQEPVDQLAEEKLPVVIVLHGHGATGRTMAAHFGDRVATNRFIAVYPNGWGQTWNTGGCCWPAAQNYIDDFAFFDQILDHLGTRPNVDLDQISIAGGSLGGIMSYDYACGRADRLAGLVSISGTRVAQCLPNAPIPTMQIHSLTDDSVAYGGGATTTEWLLGLRFSAVVPSMEAWAAGNGDCPEGPQTSTQPVMPIATATIWDCGGTVTWLETLTYGGHAWPVVGDYVVVDRLIDFLL